MRHHLMERKQDKRLSIMEGLVLPRYSVHKMLINRWERSHAKTAVYSLPVLLLLHGAGQTTKSHCILELKVAIFSPWCERLDIALASG